MKNEDKITIKTTSITTTTTIGKTRRVRFHRHFRHKLDRGEGGNSCKLHTHTHCKFNLTSSSCCDFFWLGLLIHEVLVFFRFP